MLILHKGGLSNGHLVALILGVRHRVRLQIVPDSTCRASCEGGSPSRDIYSARYIHKREGRTGCWAPEVGNETRLHEGWEDWRGKVEGVCYGSVRSWRRRTLWERRRYYYRCR